MSPSINEYEGMLFQGWPTDPHEIRRQGTMRTELARLYADQSNLSKADEHCRFAIQLLRDLPIPNEELADGFHMLYEISLLKGYGMDAISHLASAVNLSPPGSAQRARFADELRREDPRHPLAGQVW